MTDIERQGYRAFLAYSHRDGRWAKRLHRALESHRIDQDLIGRATPAGPVPKMLRPIFRDREDFAAGHSLTEQSLAALRGSRFLIVMCSPAAANSHYVNEDVRQFKAMGRADAIIPVIVDGEPGDAERECFPPALRFEVDADGNVTDRPTEVLAADVREAGDGWGLALAKVVAALLGLGTDEVYRRTEREGRRQQRIRSGFAAAVLAILVLGGVFAWQNYQKEQTLAEIEALVAQYAPAGEDGDAAPEARQSLTEAITSIAQGAASDPRYRQALDLLKAGRPADAEPLLKAVAEDKKKQAARQNREAAEAFRNLAVIARFSDPANARKYYAEAASLDPDHVEGMLWHGLMQSNAGNLQEAESAFQRVLRLGREGRDDASLYAARVRMGDLLVNRGDLNGAEVEFRAAGNFAEKLAAQDTSHTGWQYNLGQNHERIGNVLMARGNLDAALAAYTRRHEIVGTLAVQDPSNTEWQRDLSVSHEKIGNVQRARGNLDAALKSYEDSLAIAEKLVAQDPSNTHWQRDLSISFSRIGDVQRARGDLDAALKAYQDSLAVAENLAAQDPNNSNWQLHLSGSFDRIGDVQRARGNLDAALKAYQESHASFEKLAAQDPSNTKWQRVVWASMWRLAIMEGSGVSWAEVLARMEAMKARGVLLPTDEQFLEQARNLAAGN